MISDETKNQMNQAADKVFQQYFGEPLNKETLISLEKALKNSLCTILGEDLLISCYLLSIDSGAIRADVYVKEYTSDFDHSYINGYALTFTPESVV
jgi:hypothetical protein